jgi:ATP-dependent Clp protease ATP-binding subunit ClpC
MFERFTSQSRRAVVLAQEEAASLNHHYIGTEHLLLGLLREDEGAAARALASADIALAPAREEVEVIIGRGQQAPSGHIPFTPRSKKCLELSLREALQLDHDYIGTGHLLLGLIGEGHGVAITVLDRLGANLDRLREQVILELATEPEDHGDVLGAGRQVQGLRRGPATRYSPDTILARLEDFDGRLSAIERRLGITREDPGAGQGDGPENVVPPS